MVVKLVEEFARELNISYDAAFHWVSGIFIGLGFGFGFCFAICTGVPAVVVERLYSFLKNKLFKKSNDKDC